MKMRCTVSVLLGLLTLAFAASPRAQTGPTAFQDHYAEVNGQRLHDASVGQGPLVLFLHGYPSFWYQRQDVSERVGLSGSAMTGRDAAPTNDGRLRSGGIMGATVRHG